MCLISLILSRYLYCYTLVTFNMNCYVCFILFFVFLDTLRPHRVFHIQWTSTARYLEEWFWHWLIDFSHPLRLCWHFQQCDASGWATPACHGWEARRILSLAGPTRIFNISEKIKAFCCMPASWTFLSNWLLQMKSFPK